MSSNVSFVRVESQKEQTKNSDEKTLTQQWNEC